MTALKIKIKIGENEFEAEGPPDAVQAQVSTFAKLLGREETQEMETPPAEPVPEPPAIEKIIRVEGKECRKNVGNLSRSGDVERGGSVARNVTVDRLCQLRVGFRAHGDQCRESIDGRLKCRQVNRRIRKMGIPGHVCLNVGGA
jgi:hypothetical protein